MTERKADRCPTCESENQKELRYKGKQFPIGPYSKCLDDWHLLADVAAPSPAPHPRNSAPHIGVCGICGSDAICEHDRAFAAAAERPQKEKHERIDNSADRPRSDVAGNSAQNVAMTEETPQDWKEFKKEYAAELDAETPTGQPMQIPGGTYRLQRGAVPQTPPARMTAEKFEMSEEVTLVIKVRELEDRIKTLELRTKQEKRP